MTQPPTLTLTSTHDALLQQLAEARAERTGQPIEAARRTTETEAMLRGICALQRDVSKADQRSVREHIDDLLAKLEIRGEPPDIDVCVVHSPDQDRVDDIGIFRHYIGELLRGLPEAMSFYDVGHELVRAGTIVLRENNGPECAVQTLRLTAGEVLGS